MSDIGTIQRRIHQVWLGGEVPEHLKRFMRSVREKHPDWEYRLWRDDDLAELGIDRDWGKNFPHPAQFSEAVRLKVVLDHGGIYLDCDVEALRPMDPFLRYPAFAAMAKDPDPEDRVCDAVFGAVRWHPWIKWQWDRIEDWRDYRHPWGVWLMSAAPRSMVELIPVHLVYPFDWDAPEASRRPHPDSVLVHHWDKSWVK